MRPTLCMLLGGCSSLGIWYQTGTPTQPSQHCRCKYRESTAHCPRYNSFGKPKPHTQPPSTRGRIRRAHPPHTGHGWSNFVDTCVCCSPRLKSPRRTDTLPHGTCHARNSAKDKCPPHNLPQPNPRRKHNAHQHIGRAQSNQSNHARMRSRLLIRVLQTTHRSSRPR